eukprot:6194988-Pleurochrysis_carterae.AAC.1
MSSEARGLSVAGAAGVVRAELVARMDSTHDNNAAVLSTSIADWTFREGHALVLPLHDCSQPETSHFKECPGAAAALRAEWMPKDGCFFTGSGSRGQSERQAARPAPSGSFQKPTQLHPDSAAGAAGQGGGSITKAAASSALLPQRFRKQGITDGARAKFNLSGSTKGPRMKMLDVEEVTCRSTPPMHKR